MMLAVGAMSERKLKLSCHRTWFHLISAGFWSDSEKRVTITGSVHRCLGTDVAPGPGLLSMMNGRPSRSDSD